MGRLIEISVLQSLALDRLGEGKKAASALERALALAGPEGYARLFLDEAPQAVDLLSRIASSGDQGTANYAARLLEGFSERAAAFQHHRSLPISRRLPGSRSAGVSGKSCGCWQPA